MPKRKCKSCGRKMKQQFIGVYHCKCGNTRMNGQDLERTSETVFALERKQVGQKMKQVPVIKSVTQEKERVNMKNLYFAVYRDGDLEYRHRLLYRTKKQVVRSQLKKKGFEVCHVFNQYDIESVKSGEFSLDTVPDEVVAYVVENMKDWDLSF